MKKTFARGFAAIIFLGALSGVLAGGSASAANCRSAGPVLLCTFKGEVVAYSDVVEVHVLHQRGPTNETGILVGDGFTTQYSGAYLFCDSTKHKYRLITAVVGSFKNRKLAVPC